MISTDAKQMLRGTSGHSRLHVMVNTAKLALLQGVNKLNAKNAGGFHLLGMKLSLGIPGLPN